MYFSQFLVLKTVRTVSFQKKTKTVAVTSVTFKSIRLIGIETDCFQSTLLLRNKMSRGEVATTLNLLHGYFINASMNLQVKITGQE
jgi:hypothetical protein